MRGFNICIATNFGLNFVKNIDFLGLISLIFSDITHFNHDIEGFMLPGNKSIISGGVIWTEIGRIVGDGSEKSGLSKSELFCRFFKVGLSSTFDTITTTTIWRFVEIHRNDLFLRVHFFELKSEDHLFDFTRKTRNSTVTGFVRKIDLFD